MASIYLKSNSLKMSLLESLTHEKPRVIVKALMRQQKTGSLEGESLCEQKVPHSHFS